MPDGGDYQRGDFVRMPRENFARHSQAWRDAVAPAVLEDTPDVVRFDTKHPAWLAVYPPVAEKPVATKRAPAPAPKPVQPVPRERWPAWARALALMSVPEDKGLGSTAERLAGASGMKLKVWLKSKGFDCGCSARRELWDQQYPFC